MTHVICAGTYAQAEHWARSQSLRRGEFRYVSFVEHLQGLRPESTDHTFVRLPGYERQEITRHPYFSRYPWRDESL